MSAVATEKELEKSNALLIYDIILGLGEEDACPSEAMEVIRAHLDAAARDGRKIRLLLFRI